MLRSIWFSKLLWNTRISYHINIPAVFFLGPGLTGGEILDLLP